MMHWRGFKKSVKGNASSTTIQYYKCIYYKSEKPKEERCYGTGFAEYGTGFAEYGASVVMAQPESHTLAICRNLEYTGCVKTSGKMYPLMLGV